MIMTSENYQKLVKMRNKLIVMADEIEEQKSQFPNTGEEYCQCLDELIAVREIIRIINTI